MHIEKGKTYIGIVENNIDPDRLGRIKIRVLDVHSDDEEVDNLPWSSPWKDLSGDGFFVPDKGKIVTVVFEDGDPNLPEYIYSDHYNVNLEKKLVELNDSNYTSMKSLIFNHKTQVYVNDDEGLKLDHKFNLINIKEQSIDVALKDNFSKINLGTAESTQRIILGDNFLNWFDDFVKILMGDKGGPFLGNLGAPVIATPALLGSLQLYAQMKDPKFLSKNVYAVDNNDVAKLDRIADGQIGDNWESTVKDNDVTSSEEVDFESKEGSSDSTFDKPDIDNKSNISNEVLPEINPDVNVLIQLMKDKNYKIYEREHELNIVAIRTQCQRIGDRYTDMFVDKLCVFYKSDNKWILKKFSISTVPGLEFTITNNWLVEKNLISLKEWVSKIGNKIFMKDYVSMMSIRGDKNLEKGLPILVPAQYIDLYYISEYRGSKSMDVVNNAEQLIWRDNDTKNIDTFNPINYSNPELIKHNSLIRNGLSLHRGYPGGINIGNWSEGSQVFSNESSLNEFFNLCEIHRELYDNVFTYTLVLQIDMDEAAKNLSIDKSTDIFKLEEIKTEVEINKSVGVKTETISNSVEENDNEKEYNRFIIGILNPTSDASKKISGTVTITKNGPEKFATGFISGFPDGRVLGPTNSNGSISASNDVLVEEMLGILENWIISEYSVNIKLIVLDKKV
jgi:hypothetical protein